jgi:hypothetical protein
MGDRFLRPLVSRASGEGEKCVQLAVNLIRQYKQDRIVRWKRDGNIVRRHYPVQLARAINPSVLILV